MQLRCVSYVDRGARTARGMRMLSLMKNILFTVSVLACHLVVGGLRQSTVEYKSTPIPPHGRICSRVSPTTLSAPHLEASL